MLAVFGAESASRHDGLVATLLITFVVSVFASIGIIRWVVRRELGRNALRPSFPPPRLAMSIFEGPNRWLAIRSQNPPAIQAALGVRHARACSWSDALATPFEPRLFISPPVQGWVVVMGCDLPDPADDIDACFKFLCALSREVGEVQFFSRHRAVSHHGWARLTDGKVLRAYAWAGETLWNQGQPTDAERALKLRFLGYTQSAEVFGLAQREMLAANTERVGRLAAAWSLDPNTVDADELDGQGIAGALAPIRFP